MLIDHLASASAIVTCDYSLPRTSVMYVACLLFNNVV